MAIDSNDPISETGDLSLSGADPAVSSAAASPDPITGEPDAHPAAVGLGAIAAGALGAAAVGAFAGPIGAVIGAAIGAVAGGLTGHEVASAHEVPAELVTADLNGEDNGSPTDPTGRPSSVAPLPTEDVAVFPGVDMASPAMTNMTSQGAAAAALASESFASAPASTAVGVETPGVFAPSAVDAEPMAAREPQMADLPVTSRQTPVTEEPSTSQGPITAAEPLMAEEPLVAGQAPAAGERPPAQEPGSVREPLMAEESILAKEPFAAEASSAIEKPQDFTGDTGATSPFSVGVDPLEATRMAAYYRYLHRIEDGRPVDDLADWYDAEKDVRRS